MTLSDSIRLILTIYEYPNPKFAFNVYLDNATRILLYTLERATKLPSQSCQLE